MQHSIIIKHSNIINFLNFIDQNLPKIFNELFTTQFSWKKNVSIIFYNYQFDEVLNNNVINL